MEEKDKKQDGRGRPRQYKRGYPGVERGAPVLRTRLDPEVYEWITAQDDTRGILERLIRAEMERQI